MRFLPPLLLLGLAALPLAAAERDQHGREHAWKDPKGAYTLVDFAASWCAPCRTTLPRLESFARAHPEVRVLVVSVDDRREDRDLLVESLGLTLPVLWDESERIAEHYRPRGMPAVVLIDPEGRVIASRAGSRDEDWREMVRVVEEALAARRGP